MRIFGFIVIFSFLILSLVLLSSSPEVNRLSIHNIDNSDPRKQKAFFTSRNKLNKTKTEVSIDSQPSPTIENLEYKELNKQNRKWIDEYVRQQLKLPAKEIIRNIGMPMSGILLFSKANQIYSQDLPELKVLKEEWNLLKKEQAAQLFLTASFKREAGLFERIPKNPDGTRTAPYPSTPFEQFVVNAGMITRHNYGDDPTRDRLIDLMNANLIKSEEYLLR